MAPATGSPSVLHDMYQVRPSWTPSTDQGWATIAEMLFHSVNRKRGGFPSTVPPYVVTLNPTEDGGAILAGSSVNYPTAYLYNLGFLQAQQSRATVAIHPAHIVDSTIEIRQPHLEALRWIRDTTGYSQERIGELIGVSRQTLRRWQHGEPIRDVNRRRVFAVRQVLEHALTHYATRSELDAWLDTPRGAEGKTPAYYIASGDINRARLLAITSPSPRVVRPPAWVRRSVPEPFMVGLEHRQEALPQEQEIGPPDE